MIVRKKYFLPITGIGYDTFVDMNLQTVLPAPEATKGRESIENSWTFTVTYEYTLLFTNTAQPKAWTCGDTFEQANEKCSYSRSRNK